MSRIPWNETKDCEYTDFSEFPSPADPRAKQSKLNNLWQESNPHPYSSNSMKLLFTFMRVPLTALLEYRWRFDVLKNINNGFQVDGFTW